MRKKFFWILICIVVVGIAVAFFKDGGTEGQMLSVDTNTFARGELLGDGFKKYVHENPTFSIEFPENLEVNVFQEEGGGETTIFQKQSDAELPVEQKTGFQIFVVPYEPDEPVAVITPQIINTDVPGTVVEDPIVVALPGGLEALAFFGEASGIGKTREVWIVRDGYLYEITTFAHLDSWLAQIMTSWRFKE